MKAILVFIDGTICDERERVHLFDTEAFYDRKWILKDTKVPGSVACLQELMSRYQIVYIGARPPSVKEATEEWLRLKGYPEGPVYLGNSQADRINIIRKLKTEFEFLAGIGDRWDDNELHAELGCLSIILKEHEGDWNSVAGKIETYQKNLQLKKNQSFVEGKVEGLARVCPLLLKKYGPSLWDAYQESVRELAESSREERRKDDLESFKKHGLDPADLSQMATWYKLLDEENRETESLYGLQDREIIESTPTRYVEKVTRCYLAELWKKHDMPEIGYQIHCRTDAAWWDRPAWNPEIRFEQPQTLMQGHDSCIFIQYIPKDGEA